jgi:CheY-like chemotaxis protein
MRKRRTVLLADDDQFHVAYLVDRLEHEGYDVLTARTGDEAIKKIRERQGDVDIAVLDVMMPRRRHDRSLSSGMHTGVEVAKSVKRQYPNIKLVGFSVLGDETVIQWFSEIGDGYLRKPVTPDQFLDAVHVAIHGKPGRKPRCFIVHGHDESTVGELRTFLKSRLDLGNATVLREQPNLGRTLIDKFEHEASNVDMVFVLLTPDDIASSDSRLRLLLARARQNVIFELGYFYALLRRKRGRVVLLYRGKLELPSDIIGVAYIDITDGIDSAAEQIASEVSRWYSIKA